MIFGIQEKRYELGSFTSDKCTACKKSGTYTFVRSTRFLVAFGVNLVPLSSRFEGVCEGCGDVTRIDRKKGGKIARTRFGDANAVSVLRMCLGPVLIAAVIAAAVVLPLMLVPAPAISPEQLKALVSEDGRYGIENSAGDKLGYVQVDGDDKYVLYYTEQKALTGEPGAAGMTMFLNYYEDTSGDEAVLTRVMDDVGYLQDRYGTRVRTYYYDLAAQTLGYSLGVADLSAIEYSPGKAVYPYTQYISADETYAFVRVLHDDGSRRVTATFEPTSTESDVLHLSAVIVDYYENGRQVSESVYDLSSSSSAGDELTLQQPVTVDSSADDIVQYLSDNGFVPLFTETYEYFGGTSVMNAITLTLTDSDGMIQSSTQAFDVVQNGRYYIVSDLDPFE